MIELFDN